MVSLATQAPLSGLGNAKNTTHPGHTFNPQLHHLLRYHLKDTDSHTSSSHTTLPSVSLQPA